MLKVRDKTKYEYNSMYDILYLDICHSDDSYGVEETYGIVLNYDYETQKLSSIDIWNFKTKMDNKEQINLPVDFDLQDIYNQL